MAEFDDLLIEIGTEELPPKALATLSNALRDNLVSGLKQAGLAHAEVHPYATPRRLALVIEGLQTTQADRANERRGPALQAAFDGDGRPTKAAEGFARSCGVAVEDLQQLETNKGVWLVHRSVVAGKSVAELLPPLLEQALAKLPIPRPMRWSDGSAEFVRPVHWLVLLFGKEVIPATLLSVDSGRETRGHRFHHPAGLFLEDPRAYAPLLESEGHVMPDWDGRREAIRAQVVAAANEVGGHALMDPALLDEVTGLVEWPTAVVGSFDEKFLDIPAEVLISSMQGHQKYFPITDGDGKLKNHFITISNLESRDPSAVVSGNERVIRPRLEDAAFFWNQDRKRPLLERRDALKNVVFQRQLGTLFDKTERVTALTEHLSVRLGAADGIGSRAGLLSKCDLLTNMVKEFPELQGTMGRYYATHDGEDAAVADALEDQYLPRFAGDVLPGTTVGQALAIADKLDTLVAIFGIGQAPSGARDPFGLRRAALGVLRILIENRLELDLRETLTLAVNPFPAGVLRDDTSQQVYDYMMERLRGYYVDQSHGQATSIDEFEAVLALHPASPLDFHRRLDAVRAFRKLDAAASLAAANKRIANILRQAGDQVADQIAPELFELAEENELHQQAEACATDADQQMARGDYQGVLAGLASLRVAVDSYFDQVMVMADDPAVRGNRLALLTRLRGLFLQVADISRLQAPSSKPKPKPKQKPTDKE